MTDPLPASPRRDDDGFLPLKDYGALGDGRAVVLSGADGSIDWWCVPNMDSPPLFDRLLDPDDGGRFVVAPVAPFTVERRYRDESNVLETIFATADGRAVMVESLNSGSAGRLPWAELARRVEGVEGSIDFAVDLRFGRRAEAVSPYFARAGDRDVFHIGAVLGLFLASDAVGIDRREDRGLHARFTVAAGERATLAIVAGADEPLVVPAVADIDARIDRSDDEWRDWAQGLRCAGPRRDLVIRSALALKLLLYSPSGAIVAAPTSSLPERIGGAKNWDYRYAWIRDAGYTVKTFLQIGADAEAKAGLTWLLARLGDGVPRVCYTLGGDAVPPPTPIEVPGYRGSSPVVVGNAAGSQHQHGIYGDIFETAGAFVAAGNVLDAVSAETLSHLADQCADRWRQRDAGIWELPDIEHYTASKVSCWQALQHAVTLADNGHLAANCRERWSRERDRVAAWIEEHCWSDTRGAYVFHPGSDRLDAAIALAVRFGYPSRDRLRHTVAAIDAELGSGAFHFRYSGAEQEEGCFLACSFWLVEAHALLGAHDRAAAAFDAAIAGLAGGVGILPEMVDPATGAFLGNLPQGLTHLAIVQAAATLDAATTG